MNGKRIAVWALAGLLMLLGAWWLFENTEWYDEHIPGEKSDAVYKDSHYAAKAMLRRLGATVETRSSLETLPPPGATLLLTSSHWDLFPERVAHLRRFVEAGGHLVMPEDLPDGQVPFDWVPVQSLKIPKAKKLDPPAAEADAASAAKPHTDEEDEDDDDEADVAPQPAARNEPPDARSEPFSRVAPPVALPLAKGCAFLAELPALRTAGAPQRLVVCDTPDRAHYLRPKVPPLWALARGEQVEVVSVPVGQGRVTITAHSQMSRNWALMRGEHPLLLARTLNLRSGDTVWFVDDESRPPLSQLLFRHALVALLLTALAVAVALWRFGSRFGPRGANPA